MNTRWPNKTIIGLTGNIATGKSAVLRMAAQQGALVLDADKLVHEIMDNDASMQAAIAVAFGSEVRRPDGRIDRPALAAIVFSDPQALRDLENMMHPAVRQEIDRRISESDASVVVVEAIKLLEGELAALCDQIWVTNCSPRTQIERLMVCRGMDSETAALRVQAQNPQEEKVARADVVIDTSGTMADTARQFEAAWEALLARAQQADEPAVEATEPEPAGLATTTEGERPEVIVRRARPSDIPAILLLIHKATGGAVKLKRADLLMAFSERSYLIGQVGMEVTTVLGWNTDSTTAACIDRIYIHPLEAAAITGPPVLQEIENSAVELICEVVMAFLPHDAPAEVRQLFSNAGYVERQRSELHRAWQQGAAELQPEGTFIMAKVLRDVRVA